MDLADRTCAPLGDDTPALDGAAIAGFAAEVPAWTVVDEHHIERAYAFADFQTALDFVVQVGAEAEALGHHPDIELS